MANLNDIETKIQSIIDILSGDIKTITGTLPLTFTTHTAGAASDWKIEGNNDTGKNIFQIIPSEQVITEAGTIHFSSDAVNGVISVSGTGTGSESSIKQSFTVTKEMAGKYYYSADFSTEGSATTYDLYLWDNTISHRIYMWDGVTNSPTIKGTEYQECLLIEGHSIEVSMRIRANVPIENLTFKPMIRPANTTADFEPYQIGVGEHRQDGYYVPLTVSQTGQTDKNYDIFIGDSPLTEGETISKLSTGVDIELFDGENTISTTLTNKPEMTIKYKNNGGN